MTIKNPKPGPGRPKSEPTALIFVRAPEWVKFALQEMGKPSTISAGVLERYVRRNGYSKDR
ncbi:unnamed protein product, partial [marine sediment metagenome]